NNPHDIDQHGGCHGGNGGVSDSPSNFFSDACTTTRAPTTESPTTSTVTRERAPAWSIPATRERAPAWSIPTPAPRLPPSSLSAGRRRTPTPAAPPPLQIES
ncbi:unnamed protein product, partial [Laminaria digitata]